MTLTATASFGSLFGGWTGACTGLGGCTVTMTSDLAVTGHFNRVPTLTVAISGSGSVAGDGIACGGDCTEPYLPGTLVTLTPTAAAGFTFVEWLGPCLADTSCTIEMNGDTSITAVFRRMVELSIIKSDSLDPVAPGESLAYTLTVVNGGPQVATGVVVTDTLPEFATFQSATASQGSCTESMGVVTCELGDLDPGVDGATVVVEVSVSPIAPVGVPMLNTATVHGDSDTRDVDESNNSFTEETGVASARGGLFDDTELRALINDRADAIDAAIAVLNAMSIAIEAKLDSLAAAVSALEVKSDAAEVKLDAVSATANDTQSSVDAMEAKLDASLDAQITSRSSQASVDAIEAKLDAGSATDADTQDRVDAIETKLDASLDAQITSRSSQASVDSIEAQLDAVSATADDTQASVDAIKTKLDVSLDTQVTSRASQASIDAIEAELDAVSATANDTQASVDAIETKLDVSLDAQITSRASQASVDAIEAKADQQSLDISGIANLLVNQHDGISLEVIRVKNKQRYLLV